jgi:hypothetical protein
MAVLVRMVFAKISLTFINHIITKRGENGKFALPMGGPPSAGVFRPQSYNPVHVAGATLAEESVWMICYGG